MRNIYHSIFLILIILEIQHNASDNIYNIGSFFPEHRNSLNCLNCLNSMNCMNSMVHRVLMVHRFIGFLWFIGSLICQDTTYSIEAVHTTTYR